MYLLGKIPVTFPEFSYHRNGWATVIYRHAKMRSVGAIGCRGDLEWSVGRTGGGAKCPEDRHVRALAKQPCLGRVKCNRV